MRYKKCRATCPYINGPETDGYCVYCELKKESITSKPERLVEKENGKFYATDYTGYRITTIDNKYDFPLINCIEKLWEYEELEEKGLIKRV